MGPARSFVDIDVWKKAHQFVLDVYRLTESFPKHELFGLTSQFRRAAVSIPANFAEGVRRASRPDKVRFYNIAIGSLEECRYYVRLSSDLHYGETAHLRSQLEEISKMLTSYTNKVRADF